MDNCYQFGEGAQFETLFTVGKTSKFVKGRCCEDLPELGEVGGAQRLGESISMLSSKTFLPCRGNKVRKQTIWKSPFPSQEAGIHYRSVTLGNVDFFFLFVINLWLWFCPRFCLWEFLER